MTYPTAFAARPIWSSLLLLTFIASSAYSQNTERVYDPGDPAIGYNLISYESDHPDQLAEYLTAIEEMVVAQVDHVNLVVFRKVKADGGIDFRSGPKIWTIYKAAEFAKANNLKVTLTPIFETETESGWRGDWNPSGPERLMFVKHYTVLLKLLTRVADRTEVDKLNVGSELVAFSNDPRNHLYLSYIVDFCGKLFQGELGYNANFNNFQSPSVKEIFWDHPRISTVSISMYPHNRLATAEEADLSHVKPKAFARKVKRRWSEIVLEELLPYAATLKDGQGMPVAIGELGAVPLNRCAATPAAYQPSTDVDPQEQEAVIMGLIHSADQLGGLVPEITIWQWGIGDLHDNFGLNPFHNSPQQSTALEILWFMQTKPTE